MERLRDMNGRFVKRRRHREDPLSRSVAAVLVLAVVLCGLAFVAGRLVAAAHGH